MLTGGSKPLRSSSRVVARVELDLERSNTRPRNIDKVQRRYKCAPALRATPIGLFMLTWVVFLAFEFNAQAQFPSAGQADSPAEFDAYLLVLAKTTPKELISAAGDFERQWPRSELLAQVFELELEAHRSLGDSAQAILAGEKAL